MKMKGYALLNNVAFLYFVFFVSLINLFGFMYNEDYQSVFLFSCTALIVYVFNNNMIVVLLISLIFVNLLIFLNRLNISTVTIEGFDEVAETSKEEPKGVDKDTPLTNITLGNILTTLGATENDSKEKNSPKDINEDNTDSQILNDKINKSKLCDNSELIYSKINELNNKINDLTLMIK
jgi:hypothetical protein